MDEILNSSYGTSAFIQICYKNAIKKLVALKTNNDMTFERHLEEAVSDLLSLGMNVTKQSLLSDVELEIAFLQGNIPEHFGNNIHIQYKKTVRKLVELRLQNDRNYEEQLNIEYEQLVQNGMQLNIEAFRNDISLEIAMGSYIVDRNTKEISR